MPTIAVEVTEEVSHALTRQARALLLGRKAYVRAVLAAVAAQAERDAPSPAAAAGGRPVVESHERDH